MFTTMLFICWFFFSFLGNNYYLIENEFCFLYIFMLKNLLKVPANIPPDSGKSSGNEESDVDTNSADGGHSRRVRFKQLVIKYQNQNA